ncbi:MAG: hypothetical protein KJN76_03395, partial [Eudoraea sp.]|nr:hypothetical protein [Eudoraea sp.]
MKKNRRYITFKIFLVLILFASIAHAQNKYEREYRIKKSQFPMEGIKLIERKLIGAKRIRFYKETDSAKTSFEAKFKKDKLHYSIEFDKNGRLEDIEILINEVDIPEVVIKKIHDHLHSEFKKYKIRRIQQQYPFVTDENPETTLKNAFQNLLLPTINYELIVTGKNERQYVQYEMLFDSEGKFLLKRQS